MEAKPNSRLIHHALAVVGFIVAVVLRMLLDPMLGDSFPLVTLFGAVALAVWVSGVRSAIVLAIAGYVVCDYLFISPRLHVLSFNQENLISLSAYLFTCLVIIAIGHRMRTAERESSAERERLRVTLSSVGDAIITTNASGLVDYLNPIAESLTGWSTADAHGQPLSAIFRIVNETTRQPAANPAERALREGVIVGLANHTILIRKDGSETPIDDSAAPIRDARGEVIGCVLVFRDISERRQAERELEESEQRFRLMANAAPVMIWMCGPDQLCTWFNNQWLDFVGKTLEEEIGERWRENVHPDDLPRCREIYEAAFETKEPFTLEYRIRRPDGAYRWVLDHAQPLFNADKEFLGFIGSCFDFTDRIAAERDLAENRELLRVTLASIGDAVITTDAEGRVTFLNWVAESLTGWSHDEAKGKPLEEVFQIINESSRKRVANPAVRALAEGVVVGLANHTILVAKDGRERNIDDSAAPIRDASDNLVGAVLIFRDITEQRRLERENAERTEASRLLASIVESSEDAIFSVTSDGVIQSWNAASARLFGYGAEEIVGQTIMRLIPPDRIEEEEDILKRLVRGERIEHFDTMRRLKDGRILPVALTISPMKDDSGRIIGASKIVRDITEQKESERRIYELMIELREADRRKDEFLATLAHELRGPLAPLRNMLEVIKRAEVQDDLIQKARDSMDRQLNQMVRLVDDLLDVSRITRNKLELRTQKVELNSIIHQSVESCRPYIEEAQHKFDLDMPTKPIYLMGDPVRLAQVFTNLLSNACKYTEPGGEIRMVARESDGQAVIEVVDTGIGIPEDKKTVVFDMFSQVQTALDRSQGGLGIGLGLSRRLVEMHGGTIDVESAGPGQGSNFIVRLPVADAAELAEPPPPKPIEVKGLRILVVDDNQDSAVSLATLLALTGNETEVAHDGMEALHAAKRFAPDVMLLDLGLPMMNGYEVARALREHDWGKEILLVALTGWGQEEDRRRTEEAGFDHHLVKPPDLQELLKILSERQATESKA